MVIISYQQDILEIITRSLSSAAKERRDLCLDGSEYGIIDFNSLKADPGRVGRESVLTETEKLQFILSSNLSPDIFQTIHTKILENCYQLLYKFFF